MPRILDICAKVGVTVVVFEVSRRLMMRVLGSFLTVRKFLDDEDFVIEDDDGGVGGQRKTASVDEVMQWNGSDGSDCPLVETALHFPASFPHDFYLYTCPSNLVHLSCLWDEQPHNIGRMLTVLHRAKSSLDICMHMIWAPVLVEHLKYVCAELPQQVPGSSRKPVRILLGDAHFADVFKYLENVEVRVWSERATGLMHHKYFVVDGKVAVYGTPNWTVAGFRDNEEMVVVTSDKRKVDYLTAKMDELWEHPMAEVFVLAPGQKPVRPRTRLNGDDW